MLKFCPECGSKLIGGKFCANCGADLTKYGAATVVSENANAGSALDDALGNLMGFATEKQAEEAIARDFEIKNGVLIKYKGDGGDVVIPDGVIRIENCAFEKCNSLTSIKIPNSVTSIGGWAFFGCDSLIRIEIPDSITSIEDCAFLRCKSLMSATIGSNVTNIDGSAFSGCSNLYSLIVKSGNKRFHSIDNCIVETASKAIVVGCNNSRLPMDGSVTSIRHHAFAERNGLISIMIPNGVTSIGDYAFCKCGNLTNIAVPNSVISIGEAAFYGCYNLASVTIASNCQFVSGPYEAYNSFPEECKIIKS